MKFRKKSTAKTEISTASMPDIVFLLLFFFMVSATIKPQDNKVLTKMPPAQAITTVQKQFLIKEIQIGKLRDNQRMKDHKIIANGEIIDIKDLGHWVETERSSLDEAYKDQMIVLLKVDELVDMGLVADVQQELRKHNARKVLYRTLKKEDY